MVQIHVTTKLSYCVSLERAIVIPKPPDANATQSIIGAALGGYLIADQILKAPRSREKSAILAAPLDQLGLSVTATVTLPIFPWKAKGAS